MYAHDLARRLYEGPNVHVSVLAEQEGFWGESIKIKKLPPTSSVTLEVPWSNPIDLTDHPDGFDKLCDRARAAARKLPETAIFVDVGSRKGGSSLALLEAVRTSWKLGRWVFSIDPYGDKPYNGGESLYGEEQCRLMHFATSLYAIQHKLNFQHWRLTSLDYIRIIDTIGFWDAGKPLERQYGFVILDGDHDADTVSAEYNYFWPRLASGGTLVMDDVAYYRDDERLSAIIASATISADTQMAYLQKP